MIIQTGVKWCDELKNRNQILAWSSTWSVPVSRLRIPGSHWTSTQSATRSSFTQPHDHRLSRLICVYSAPRSAPTQPCDVRLTDTWEALWASLSATISRLISTCQRLYEHLSAAWLVPVSCLTTAHSADWKAPMQLHDKHQSAAWKSPVSSLIRAY